MDENAANGNARLSRLCPVALGIVCLAPFVRLLLPGDSIVSEPGRDYGSLHLPLAEFAREELMAGRLPLWNPYVGCGQPLHAAQQASLCYPLSTALIMACGANSGLKVSIFFHLAICFTGAYLLARRAALSRPAAGYAALVTTWSGALMGHLAEGHVSMVFQTALAPWFILALVNLFSSPGARAVLHLALIGSLCALADHPQVLYYTLVAGALCAGGSLCFGEASRHRWRVIAWGSSAAAIVALVAAVQVVPAIELVRDGLHESGRGKIQFGGTYALDGSDSGRLLMPYLNGTPFARVAQFDGHDHYHERVVYLGLAVPVLAAYGLLRGKTARWQWAAAWGVVLGLAVAFGDSTPAFATLGRLLPGLSLFRCPGRVFCIVSLPAALLAARGLDALACGDSQIGRRAKYRFAAVALAAAGIPVYAALFNLPSLEWPRYAEYLRLHLLVSVSLWAMLAVEVLVIVSLAATCRLRGWMVWLPLIVAAVFDLGYFNVPNVRMQDREPLGAARLPPADSMTRFLEAPNFPHIVYDGLRYNRWVRAAIVEHRPAVGTYDGGVLPQATARLFKAIEADAPSTLALAACGYICSGNSGIVKRVEGVVPRLRFVREQSGGGDLPIEGVSNAVVRRLEAHSEPVKLIHATPRRLEIEIEAPSNGWLVVADTYYPGWQCEVDGRDQEILLAHGVFRRVRVERGRRRIVMRYDPLSFRIGVIASAAGIVACAALFLFCLKAPRRQR